MTTAPTSLARPIQDLVSEKEKATTGALSSSATSKFSGTWGIRWVMNPTAKGRSVWERMWVICSRTQSAPPPLMPPKLPKPPDRETAAANTPPHTISGIDGVQHCQTFINLAIKERTFG